ncbi:CheR family methyltransferase [Thermodesulfobacterium hydrogeniphilum]|uniref:CheR family methyltransferase n=1 Tax=Thermodesulfobacterium hydrogeniphilum TaxID=161156 RepID=UPI00056F718A|nr:protein-glutamate O-methyltransferase CheR [Thermodesulfobacterium hydrogeniphilum]
MERAIFDFFTTLVEKFSGISYGEGKEYLVESRLSELALSLGYKDIKELYNRIKQGFDHKLLNEIIDALTTNETYFFRDFYPFEALRNYILPELFKKREKEKKISIWSAACSTGQEPYSIALILLEHFSIYLKKFKVFIYATDISKKSIEKAKKGVYNQIEINRGLPVNFLIKYFKQEGPYWKIDEKVKNIVNFEVLNLLETRQKIKEKFDIIFCRYVLIYFSNQVKQKVFKDLWNCLKPGGYLILGATEIAPLTFPDMERKVIGKTSCYYKKD